MQGAKLKVKRTVDMKQQIGDVAGAIWRVLHEKDKVSLSTLPKMIKEPEAVALQAIGWLAREDKIQYQTEGRTTYVALTPQERMK
jgi:hypothetical protein